jgi:hypothetical protein
MTERRGYSLAAQCVVKVRGSKLRNVLKRIVACYKVQNYSGWWQTAKVGIKRWTVDVCKHDR